VKKKKITEEGRKKNPISRLMPQRLELVHPEDCAMRTKTRRRLEPPEVTVLAGEAGVAAPVVAHLVPWLHAAHLHGVADTRIGHDELLHGNADLREVDAAIMVDIEGVEEPLSLIGRHVVVEDGEKAHDLVEGDVTVAGDLVPGALELGLTLGGPDGLVVHVGTELALEDRIATREATDGSAHRGHTTSGHAVAGHSGHGRLAVAGHSGHGGLAVTGHSRHRRLIHLVSTSLELKGLLLQQQKIVSSRWRKKEEKKKI